MARAEIAAGFFLLFVGVAASVPRSAYAQDAEPSEPGTDATSESGARLTAPQPFRRKVAVVQATTIGIDPVVGEHATARIEITAQSMGYALESSDHVRQATLRLQASSPPTPADLWRLGYVTGVERVIGARVSAERGRYVVELTVASLDGTGPFQVRGFAGAHDLHEVVEALVLEVLPPPNDFRAEEAARLRERATQPTAAPSRRAYEPPPRRSRHPGRRWDLALRTESAFGVGDTNFYNHLLGARLDFRITRSILVGAFFAYANLRGRGQRVNNLMSLLQLEYRIDIAGVDGLTVPLRGGAGYVPFNGPVVRISAGINYAISDRFELGLDLLSPTFWLVPGGRVASFNAALDAIVRFGRLGGEAASAIESGSREAD